MDHLIAIVNENSSNSRWSSTDRDHAYAEYVAALLKPNSARGRNRVRLTILAAHSKHLQEMSPILKDQSQSDQSWAQTLIRTLASASSHATYRRRLYFDLDSEVPWAGQAVRPILTTGLLVKVLATGQANNHLGHASIERAREFIYENYQTNILIAANRYDTKRAWSTCRAIAPLAAAFLDFIQSRQATRLNSGTLSEVRKHIDNIVLDATAYRAFLLRPMRRGNKSLLNESELFPLPSVPTPLTIVSPPPGLPPWGRRPDSLMAI